MDRPSIYFCSSPSLALPPLNCAPSPLPATASIFSSYQSFAETSTSIPEFRRRLSILLSHGINHPCGTYHRNEEGYLKGPARNPYVNGHSHVAGIIMVSIHDSALPAIIEPTMNIPTCILFLPLCCDNIHTLIVVSARLHLVNRCKLASCENA
ncbi:hypothetical protein J6590_001266 [Homalodisca vitripennis]|nr:hypothetical protein J6590_001266 [Homalodisca vitripennis]